MATSPTTTTTTTVRSSSVPSLPPPSPKSPPEYPDLYGKRRETARVHMLEREITFLEEELKSVEGLQAASRCCKEIADYVMANADPLLPSDHDSYAFFSFKQNQEEPSVMWLLEVALLFVEKYDKKEIKHQSPANNFFSTLAPFSLEYLLVKRKRLMTNERDPFPFCEDYVACPVLTSLGSVAAVAAVKGYLYN
ncbi:Guanine nucleotide-binding protein subunit gamma 3 [Glycine soja]